MFDPNHCTGGEQEVEVERIRVAHRFVRHILANM
jgi:hypothetical protein